MILKIPSFKTSVTNFTTICFGIGLLATSWKNTSMNSFSGQCIKIPFYSSSTFTTDLKIGSRSQLVAIGFNTQRHLSRAFIGKQNLGMFRKDPCSWSLKRVSLRIWRLKASPSYDSVTLTSSNHMMVHLTRNASAVTSWNRSQGRKKS